MKSILSILLLAAAAAGPAAAEDIRVSLADKDPAAIQAEIDKAAQTVCWSGYRDGELELHEMMSCSRLISSDAMAQLKAIEARAARPTASLGALASNGLTSDAAK